MTRDQFISYFFIALLVFVAGMVIQIFSPFIKAIFWSAILAFAFHPVYSRLKNGLRSDTLAALLMTVLIFLLVVPPVIFLIINLATQAIDLYQFVADYIRQGRLETLIDRVRSIHTIQNIEERIIEWEPFRKNLESWLLSSARGIGNFTAAQAGTITKNLFFVVLNVFMMTFLVFVFLKDGQMIFDFIYQTAPLDEKNKRPIFDRISQTLSAVIRGQLLTGLTQSIVAGLFFWLIGIPIPIFFATLTFITAMIPVIGAASIWVPLVIYLAAIQEWTKAGMLFAFGALVISLIDNIMKPALIGEKTKLPYFLLFFGILGGIKIYGLMGIFLAPTLLSLFFALVGIYQKRNW